MFLTAMLCIGILSIPTFIIIGVKSKKIKGEKE
jgi:hypothetical protein